MGEIFSIYGVSVGASGDFALQSDLWRGTVTNIRIPKGLVAKIWTKRISGDAVVVTLNLTRDITVATPTYVALDTQRLAAAGELVVEKERKPIIINSRTGKEAFKFSFSGAAGTSYIMAEVELTEEEEVRG